MRIIVSTPGSRFLPEYTYISTLVFKDFLGLPLEVRPGGQADRWRISLDGQALELGNAFFPETEPETYFRLGHLAEEPHRLTPSEEADPIPVLAAKKGQPLPDILGTMFFLLTSFEDHCPLPRDKHDRLCPQSSWAGRHGLLHRAIVDELLAELLRRLALAGINISCTPPAYEAVYSCDVDMPFRWHTLPTARFIRHLGGALLKRRSLAEFTAMLLARAVPGMDPYFSFAAILDALHDHGLKGRFYFMAGTAPGVYDSPYDLNIKPLRTLMERLAREGHTIGFHPSYHTATNEELFAQELERLRRCAPTDILEGRQHYLRFRGAATWRMWAAHGLHCDSSLGFSHALGFRCGTAREYQVYDLEHRQPLPLRERPLLLMDGTLMETAPNHRDALEKADSLCQTVRRHGGQMTFLWHNSMLHPKSLRHSLHAILDTFAAPSRTQ